MSIDIRKLRYFLVLSEELHFRRAAERLNITQAPLSLAIQVLERELGAQLFHRTQRRVSLTEIGAAFRGHALSIVGQLEHAVEDIHAMATGEAGYLRIGFTPACALSTFFPRAVSAFRARYPLVKMSLGEMTSKEQIIAIANREIDIGFFRTLSPLKQSAINFTFLTEEALVVAMHAGHPLTQYKSLSVRALEDEPLIFPSPKAGVGIHDQVMELFSDQGLTPNIVQQVNEASIAISLAAAGLGLAIVPPDLQSIKVSNIVYRPLSDAGAITQLLFGNRLGEKSTLVTNFRHLTQTMIATTMQKAEKGERVSDA